MVDTQELDALKRVNLADVVERFTTLRKASGREFCGPCPRAGCDADEDGFHVFEDVHFASPWWLSGVSMCVL